MKVIYGFLIGAGIVGAIIGLFGLWLRMFMWLDSIVGVGLAFTINAMLLFGAIGAKAAHDGVFDKCTPRDPQVSE